MATPPPINVSEDRLRAVFAEFELRLMSALAERLDAKADKVKFEALELRVDHLEQRAVTREVLAELGWKLIAALGAIATFVGLILYYAFR